MELLQINPVKHREELLVIEHEAPTVEKVSTGKPFIEANSIECSLKEIREVHTIPVFIKDNEPLISQAEFIDATMQVAREVFEGETILSPSIRLSHEIKGRIPSAKDKPVSQLLENEKTVYFERMAYIIEVPSISRVVDGCNLSLTIGGVKSYNQDNLYSRKGTSDEHFKIFIGFKNSVCTNLCVSSDGFISNLRVSDINQLKINIRALLQNFNQHYFYNSLENLSQYYITEEQFAKLVGRCKMYAHLPKAIQNTIPQMMFGEAQLTTVVRDYYKDNSFCKNDDGTINLFKLYSLFTGANKSSYIDSFIDRGVNAFSFVYAIKMALDEKQQNWFLN